MVQIEFAAGGKKGEAGKGKRRKKERPHHFT
jgi:hypothetical protein